MLAGVLGGTAGCHGSSPHAKDPTEGAMHLGRIGYTQPFGRNPNAVPVTASKDTPRAKTPGRYGGDVDRLQKLIERQWVHRSVHEELDDDAVRAMRAGACDLISPKTKTSEVARRVRGLLCTLSDANLRIIDAPDATLRDSGLRFEVANGALLVVGHTDGRYASAPTPGEMVVAVDEKPVWKYLGRQCVEPASSPGGRAAIAADRLGVQSRAAGQSARPRSVTLRRSSGKLHKVKLQWALAESPQGACVEAQRTDDGIGVLRIHRLGCTEVVDGQTEFARQFAAALGSLNGVSQFAVDLRRTEGNDLPTGKWAAEHLVSSSPAWIRHRTARTGFVDAPIEPQPSALPSTSAWVLIGPRCSEVCELVASVLAQAPNTTTIGEATAGTVGRGVQEPKHYALPSIGISIAIPDTIYATPGSDVSLERRGVVPEILIRATYEDVQNGRDAVLEGIRRRVSPAASGE